MTYFLIPSCRALLLGWSLGGRLLLDGSESGVAAVVVVVVVVLSVGGGGVSGTGGGLFAWRCLPLLFLNGFRKEYWGLSESNKHKFKRRH